MLMVAMRRAVGARIYALVGVLGDAGDRGILSCVNGRVGDAQSDQQQVLNADVRKPWTVAIVPIWVVWLMACLVESVDFRSRRIRERWTAG